MEEATWETEDLYKRYVSTLILWLLAVVVLLYEILRTKFS